MPIIHDPNVTHEWVTIGDTMVTRTLAGDIPAHLWGPFVEELADAKIEKLLALVVGAASINATQRKNAADLFRDKGILTVVVTNDRLVRGVITALSWMGANVKPFAWADLDKAFERLDPTDQTRAELWELAERCGDER